MFPESILLPFSELSADGFLGLLLQISWKGSLLLASVLLVNRLATRIAAATRCLLLLGACIGLVLVALLSPHLPEVGVPIIPESVNLFLNPEPPITEVGWEEARSVPSSGGSSLDRSRVVGRLRFESRDSELIASLKPWTARLGPWIPVIWLLGSAFLIGRLLAGHILAHFEARDATPLEDPGWFSIVDSLTRRMRFQQEIRLCVSSDQPVPKTIGILRPVILLPSHCYKWPTSRKEAVLAHELAHIRRRDLALQTLARLACSLHWFNPLAWAVENQFRLESERACDDEVLQLGIRPSVYARHLLSFVKYMARDRVQVLATAAMVRSSDLEERILSMLDTARARRSLNLKHLPLLGLLLCLIAIPLSSLTLGFVTQAEDQREVEVVDSPTPPPPPPPPAPEAPSPPAPEPPLPPPPPPAPKAPDIGSSHSDAEPPAPPAPPAAPAPSETPPPPPPPAPPAAPRPPRQEAPASEEEEQIQELARARKELERISRELQAHTTSMLEPLNAQLAARRVEIEEASEELNELADTSLREMQRQFKRTRAELKAVSRERKRAEERLRETRRYLERVRVEMREAAEASTPPQAPPIEP